MEGIAYVMSNPLEDMAKNTSYFISLAVSRLWTRQMEHVLWLEDDGEVDGEVEIFSCAETARLFMYESLCSFQHLMTSTYTTNAAEPVASVRMDIDDIIASSLSSVVLSVCVCSECFL